MAAEGKPKAGEKTGMKVMVLGASGIIGQQETKSFSSLERARAARKANREPLAVRLWRRVEKTDSCWLWTGTRLKDGYGQISVAGKNRYVHRIAYAIVIGPIPKGKCLDHLCRVRHCVNPTHLEPVSIQENIQRGDLWKVNGLKTHCRQGHPYSGENLLMVSGERRCRTCVNANARKYRDQLRILCVS